LIDYTATITLPTAPALTRP